MTWYYDIADDGSSMDVYDQTGKVVETLQNGGEGFRIPDDVTSVMQSQIVPTDSDGMSAYEIEVMADLSARDIEEGTPP